MEEKLNVLRERLAALGSVAVAFSSGVDSTFLLRVAHETLGGRAVALTARAHWFPERETEEAAAFCAREGIRQITVDIDENDIAGFCENPPDRCYHCKRALFSRFLEAAAQNGLAAVVEGSNVDDLGDYRPGLRAVAELGIVSPLREAGLTKDEIRALSRKMGLPTWEKPSFACMASRFVYGETITPERLKMVEQAEELLHRLGFLQVRVRIHGLLARIEVQPEKLAELLAQRARIYAVLRELGFQYVTMDLLGYRTGSMNETLKEEK